jgi:hypothetical protein
MPLQIVIIASCRHKLFVVVVFREPGDLEGPRILAGQFKPESSLTFELRPKLMLYLRSKQVYEHSHFLLSRKASDSLDFRGSRQQSKGHLCKIGKQFTIVVFLT